MRNLKTVISKPAALIVFSSKLAGLGNALAHTEFNACLKAILDATLKATIGFVILSSLLAVAEDTVYRSTDKNGNAVFTDQATENAQEIEIKETATYTETVPTYTPTSKKKNQYKSMGYTRISILQPASEEAVRSNSGNLTVSYSLQPALESKHSTELLIDGSPVQSSGSGGSFSLTNIDRGTHTLIVQVIDDSGSVLITSDSIMITMLRYAQAHRISPHGSRQPH
jgi:hypothetical protein